MNFDISVIPYWLKNRLKELAPKLYLHATNNSQNFLDVLGDSKISNRAGCMALDSSIVEIDKSITIFDWYPQYIAYYSQMIKDGIDVSTAKSLASSQTFVDGRKYGDPRFKIESALQLVGLLSYSSVKDLPQDIPDSIILLSMFFEKEIIDNLLYEINNDFSVSSYMIYGKIQLLKALTYSEKRFIINLILGIDEQ